MTVLKAGIIGTVCLGFSVIYPQEVLAEGLKNEGFLKLSSEQKKYWLYSAIDTLGFVAAYKDKQKGQCVWEWYGKDIAKKNGLIEAYMAKNPEKSPSAILIGLTEKACGSYVREKMAR